MMIRVIESPWRLPTSKDRTGRIQTDIYHIQSVPQGRNVCILVMESVNRACPT